MKKSKKPKTELGMEENIEGALCYLLIWVTGIIFFLLERKSKFVRFHAMQSILTFLGLTVVSIFFGAIPVTGVAFSPLIGLLMIILWIVLMVKAYQGEWFKLPIVGEISEEQVKK